MNRKLSKLKKIIGESEIFSIYAENEKTNQFFLRSANEDKIAITLTDKYIRIEYIMFFSADMVNLYSFAKLVDLAAKYGFMLKGFAPYAQMQTSVRMWKEVPFESAGDELVPELRNAASSIDTVTRYCMHLLKSAELKRVDISMFAGLDPNFIDIEQMGIKKEIIHGSWKTFVDNLNNSDLEKEVVDQLTPYLDACQSFEEKNKCLLAEVGASLTSMLNDYADKPKVSKLDIN